ncbi:MAG: hypothetical protein QM539_03635 [Alphaproteobacteria bacterium]|nr:hypothetical protein [Alphaproteobacteria bacterium]
MNLSIKELSPHLFWDVDVNNFDLNKYQVQVVTKVLQFGNWNDWKLLIKGYGIETLKDICLNIRSLDDKTLTYLATIFEIDIKSFRCYKNKPLAPNFWNC